MMAADWYAPAVLERAADLIATVGWCQGVSGLNTRGETIDPNDHDDGDVVAAWSIVSAIGGAILALGLPDIHTPEDQAIAALALSLIPRGELTLEDHDPLEPDQVQDAWLHALNDWNDVDGRTREQVVAALRNAALLGP